MSLGTVQGVEKVRIADFVHGSDGLGNTNPTPPKGQALSTSGPQFLVDMVTRVPHQVTVVALAPLSNIAKVQHVLIRHTLLPIPGAKNHLG